MDLIDIKSESSFQEQVSNQVQLKIDAGVLRIIKMYLCVRVNN